MAGEQFSLCWDNFHSNMSTGLSSLYKTEDLVDVTLAAEGRYLKAHKIVLSVCSPYFRELFQVNPCKHPIVFLKDVSYNALSNLLEFMYQGEVKVSQDDLGTFIKTAEALKIKGLSGDGLKQNDSAAAPQTNVSLTEETPITRKPVKEREKSLAPIEHVSKCMKVDTESSPPLTILPQQQQPQTTQIAPQPVAEVYLEQNPVEEHFMHFKLEPEETEVALTKEEDISYDNSAMDDMGIDNSSDYFMESTSEIDETAGTSSAMDNVDAIDNNQEAGEATANLLPVTSRPLYEKEYNEFCKWRQSRGVKGATEPVILAYFKNKAETYAASSLWTQFSMLRSCLEIKEKVKISEYRSVIAFIKQKNVGYKGKKAKILTRDEINTFLFSAPDEVFLMIKVAFLFAISGACRVKELTNITIDDIEDKDTLLVVRIPKTKTHVKRVFTIIPDGDVVNAVALYRKYIALRPPNMKNRRLFLLYRNGKCTRQACGEQFFASIPQRIAKFLNLPEAAKYTGHSMRRSSATLLANTGADMRLKRLCS